MTPVSPIRPSEAALSYIGHNRVWIGAAHRPPMSLMSIFHELQNRFCSCMKHWHQFSSADRRPRSVFRTRLTRPITAPFPKVRGRAQLSIARASHRAGGGDRETPRAPGGTPEVFDISRNLALISCTYITLRTYSCTTGMYPRYGPKFSVILNQFQCIFICFIFFLF